MARPMAKSRGLPGSKAMNRRAGRARNALRAWRAQIEYLTSTPSRRELQRPKTEVFALMRCWKILKRETPELVEKIVRLQAIGRLTDLPESCQQQLHKTIEQTAAITV